MTTTTFNFSWGMPDPGGSPNTWGTTLNTTTQAIDQKAFDLQQAMVPIGAVTMYAGPTAPPNWLFCNGQSLSQAAPYDKLYAAIGGYFNVAGAPAGTFNLPNLQQKYPLGAGPNPLGATGGNFQTTIAPGMLPSHAHPITDVQHTHTVNQWAHDHGISQTPHDHGVFSMNHAHSGNLMRFVGAGGTQGVGTVPNNVKLGNTDNNETGSGATDARNANIGRADTQTSAISIQGSGTGLSVTGNTGGGLPMSVVPPFVALNFIIRFQ